MIGRRSNPSCARVLFLPSKYRFTVSCRCLLLPIVACSRFHGDASNIQRMTYAERFRPNCALEASLVSFPRQDFTNHEGPGECACKP